MSLGGRQAQCARLRRVQPEKDHDAAILGGLQARRSRLPRRVGAIVGADESRAH